MKINNIFHAARTLKEIKERPIGFFIDLIIGTIISALIPIPFVGSVVARYKSLILWMIGGLVLTGLICLFAITLTLFSPFIFFNPTQTGNRGINITGLQGSQLLKALEGYIEAGFTNTDVPNRNPLGGSGYTNSIITEDYHQAGYAFFDGVHTGIDLVPSNNYYQTNKAYKLTGQIIVFSTLNGTGLYYVDQYGSNTVEITNSNSTMKSIDMHLASSFISTGQTVVAGQPIGIMGQTGEATGVHLHYELRVNQNGTFVTVDPKGYIQ